MPTSWLRLLAPMVLAVCIASCGRPARPVLFPNEHFHQVGAAAAQRDIDQCLQQAAQSGLGSQQGKRVAGQTVAGGAVGAVAGTATGAIAGNIGGGAVAGAAAGATGGLLHGLLSGEQLNPAQRRYVDECLRQKGYQPMGWQ
jgi:outer membrane lipoprotein SlyB